MRTVIIAGSARTNGDTQKLADSLCEKTGWDTLSLCAYTILPYDYSHANSTDDFLPLITKVIEQYDIIIFATPVYWYSMSGIMKIFFDRFTDLLTVNKDLGRMLRGKKTATVSSSEGDNLGDDFWLPFTATANYLGMQYLGSMHSIANAPNEKNLNAFIAKITTTQAKFV